MGDNFFEDQPVEAPSKSETPKKEVKTAKKGPANKNAKPAAKAAAAKATAKAQTSEGMSLPQQVDLVWTVAFIVVAFVVGFFVRGLFIPAVTATADTGGSATFAPSTPGAGSTTAPTLSEDQLDQGLPQGHPSVGDSGVPQPGAGAVPGGTSTQDASGSKSTSPGGAMGNIKSDVPASGTLDQDGQSVEVPADKLPDDKK